MSVIKGLISCANRWLDLKGFKSGTTKLCHKFSTGAGGVYAFLNCLNIETLETFVGT